jgi:hypothetical protein
MAQRKTFMAVRRCLGAWFTGVMIIPSMAADFKNISRKDAGLMETALSGLASGYVLTDGFIRIPGVEVLAGAMSMD